MRFDTEVKNAEINNILKKYTETIVKKYMENRVNELKKDVRIIVEKMVEIKKLIVNNYAEYERFEKKLL